MLISIPLYIALALAGTVARKPHLDYRLRVDPADLTGVSVELRVRNAPAGITIAAHAHPEYDDKYWRHVEGLAVTDAQGAPVTVTRADSVLWRISNPAGDIVIRYRVRFPRENMPRSSWRPFLTPTGGLIGGPHSFLYVVGQENLPASVTLDIPEGWKVATGLAGPPTARSFQAADLHTLMESPMLVGAMSDWSFRVRNIPHRVVYWHLPDATPFDTVAFAGSIERFANQAMDLFGSAPYREYTFIIQDGAYSGGLEHPNSVTLGAPSAELARDPTATMRETAHEFVHTWNLMAIKPIEYRKVDYRVQPPVAGLWFSEGLTLFYADLLMRRAGIPRPDSTRVIHLEDLIERYLAAPGNSRFSAEQVSRVAYNASPGSLGDYSASSHLQGELLGTILDLRIRAATGGTRSMDDVMRLMFAASRNGGFTGADVQRAVEQACRCSAATVFDQHVRNGTPIDFDAYLGPLGMRLSTKWVGAVDDSGKAYRDMRMWAWQEGNEPLLRLRITDPNSAWGRAGLHTNDQLVSINGAPVRTWPELRAFLSGFAMGDSATIVVQRPSGPMTVRVVMQGYEAPVVRIEKVTDATAAQQRLRADWLAGRQAGR